MNRDELPYELGGCLCFFSSQIYGQVTRKERRQCYDTIKTYTII